MYFYLGYMLILLTENSITNTVNIFQCKICIQRQSQHTQCQMLCYRGFLRSSSRIVPIALKAVSQRIEILSRRDSLFFQHRKDFITSILISIEHNREVCIVAFHILLNSTKLNSFYTKKALTIMNPYQLSFH